MEAIVLAGGFGTRLREMVPELPKPMASVAGRPFLEIVLNDLARKGFKRVILSLGYKADLIRGHFGSRFARMDIAYAIEDTPLGTGGAVRLCLSHCLADHVWVFNGDTFLDLEVETLELKWQKHRQLIIVAREVLDTSRYGRLLLQTGQVMGFTEKGISGPGFINAGCYVFGSDQLDDWPLNKPFSLELDFLSEIVKTNPVNAFVTQGLFIDIGIPEDYRRAQTLLADRV